MKKRYLLLAVGVNLLIGIAAGADLLPPIDGGADGAVCRVIAPAMLIAATQWNRQAKKN